MINGFNPSMGSLFFILVNDGTDAVSGTFAGLAQNSTLSFGGHTYMLTYTGNLATLSFTGGNDVALRVVAPEPNALTMLTGGFALLIGMQRRRRRLPASR